MRPRLILFDIDQTLVHTSGAGMRSLRRALVDCLGLHLPDGFVEPGGKTDPAILREIVERLEVRLPSGLEAEEAAIWERYEHYLVAELEASREHCGLEPGAAELVQRLHDDPRVCLGLLTGNLERTARVKLRPFGLDSYFPVGGYGSDHVDRERLGPIALQRALLHYGCELHAEEAWVVGDTTRDIKAARALGARVLAVATGHQSVEELAAARPDAVRPTLEDTDEVARLILQ